MGQWAGWGDWLQGGGRGLAAQDGWGDAEGRIGCPERGGCGGGQAGGGGEGLAAQASAGQGAVGSVVCRCIPFLPDPSRMLFRASFGCCPGLSETSLPFKNRN